MSENIHHLEIELVELSFRIRDLKDRVLKAKDVGRPEYTALKKELRQLQWQALFYIEKIENIKRET